MLSPKGVVRTALPDLDREAKDTHLLVVQAKDMRGQMGGLSGSTSVTVIVTDVNDNPPHFPRSESTLVLLVDVVQVDQLRPVQTCVWQQEVTSSVFQSLNRFRLWWPRSEPWIWTRDQMLTWITGSWMETVWGPSASPPIPTRRKD